MGNGRLVVLAKSSPQTLQLLYFSANDPQLFEYMRNKQPTHFPCQSQSIQPGQSFPPPLTKAHWGLNLFSFSVIYIYIFFFKGGGRSVSMTGMTETPGNIMYKLELEAGRETIRPGFK